jgi:periplasmic protein TonB
MGGLLVKRFRPDYPAEALAARIQGTVMLSAEINQQEEIVNLELIDGPIELAGSAINAVRRWKYRPYVLNGEPVEVRTQVQVNYQLAGN